ncbi:MULTISPECIES: malonic semialdehyde reductase [unclassified Mycolicibacterium]|uniref:malonic semialdehyde reductase n=1 Tax=unclassified Mycolicibacterium TaxID=2636767 RepID=UPI002ED8F709
MADGNGSKTIEALPTLDTAGRETLFTRARTANAFADTAVSDGTLLEAWDLARWAPTSVNSQPLRILFIRKGNARDRLIPHMFEPNKLKTAQAPIVAVLATDTRFHEQIPVVFPVRPEMADLFEASPELQSATGSFNTALQAAYFILAVRAVGLAAGPMGGFDAGGVDREFFPDGQWKSALVVNLGYPRENSWAERLPRLDPVDIVRWV